MLVLSRPLWVGGDEFPRVPFLAGWPAVPRLAEWALYLGLLAAVGLTAVGRSVTAAYPVSLTLSIALVLGDQERFQPWLYQYAMTGLFLWSDRGGSGMRRARWWFLALYAYSGFSKLDRSFCDELGLTFLRALTSPFHVDPAGWPVSGRVAATLMMPAGEIALAALLAIGATRRAGRVGAVLLHAGLIAVLGPVGLGQSAIVLVWNAAVAAEVWIVFGPDLRGRVGPSATPLGRLAGSAAWVAFGVGVALPMGERWGLCDAWPAHALYASHVGRLAVDLHESALEACPPQIRSHARRVDDGPWFRLDLTGWSREVRGTPVYPQNRASLGLAEALAARYGRRGPVRVIDLGPADRWTGRRSRREAVGLDAIGRLIDAHRLNGHPAPRPADLTH